MPTYNAEVAKKILKERNLILECGYFNEGWLACSDQLTDNSNLEYLDNFIKILMLSFICFEVNSDNFFCLPSI